jgi:hypothetical protein
MSEVNDDDEDDEEGSGEVSIAKCCLVSVLLIILRWSNLGLFAISLQEDDDDE